MAKTPIQRGHRTCSLSSSADIAGSPIHPMSRFVIVMQTWIAPIASAGLAFSTSIADAVRTCPDVRRREICAGRKATNAYSAATKNAFNPIRNGTESNCQGFIRGD